MRNTRIVTGIVAVLCIAACIMVPVSATSVDGDHGGRLGCHLDQLEEQGYDVSAIRAALENGNHETARELMRAVMQKHADELPDRPPGWRKCPRSSAIDLGAGEEQLQI